MREVVWEVADLIAQEITESGAGAWSTPIVMVRKSNGDWRLCCDYRKIDKHVNIPQQPLPRTQNILAFLKGKKYFSSMDMSSKFYLIKLTEKSRLKTSFMTPDCRRQYRRLFSALPQAQPPFSVR